MTSKEALKKLEYYTDSQSRKSIDYACYGNIYQTEIDIIKKDLERLEQLEKIFSDSHICEIQARFNEIECSADKCDNCPLGFESGICLKNTFEKKWELQKENNNLKKALDKACESLEWGCPVEQDLIDYLDCENCKNTEKECWKTYFLKEVLENE